MARPVRLLADLPAAGSPVVSWSTVTSPALVLGRLATDPAIDHDAVAAAGAEVVRRSSGGGPVLWDAGLLALDVALPPGHLLAGADVVEAYRWLGEALADALGGLGVPEIEVVSVERSRAARRRPGPAADACYGGLSPYEVTAGGRKVVGLSQARRRAGALVQAGILLSLDAPLLARLLGRDAAFADGLARTATGLDGIRPDLTGDEIVAAADAAIVRRLGIRLQPAAVDGRGGEG